jgi:uncharacterized protein (TIGR02145 family)
MAGVMLCATVSCGDPDVGPGPEEPDTTVKVESVSLDEPTLTLPEEATFTLRATVLPEDATDPSVVWTSNAPTIAHVDENGLVTALKRGDAIITATTKEGSKKADCAVSVTATHPVLGTVSFRTPTVWTIGAQSWSDVVMASRCKKRDFYGGFHGEPNEVDCRQNADNYGDLFSWELVRLHGGVLCPDGWRVPTEDDFCTLDKTLNNDSECKVRGIIAPGDPFPSLDAYIGDWGGELGGASNYDGMLQFQGVTGHYWSQSPWGDSDVHAILLLLGWNITHPSQYTGQYYGMPVRCVKDI